MRIVDVKDGYAFIAFLAKHEINVIRTKAILGQRLISMEDYPLLIVKSDFKPSGGNIYYTYQITDELSIKLNVPIAQMDWVTPTTDNLAICIEVFEHGYIVPSE